MKKFTTLGVAIVAALMMVGLSSQANAVTLGKYSKGLLVPVTVHGDGLDTVVGIICGDYTTVYWTFFDKNSNPVVDDQIPCTRHQLIKFSLNDKAPNTEGIEGYIVFTANAGDGSRDKNKTDVIQDDDHKTLTGNAFLIDAVNDDAVFVPVVPLERCDYLPDGAVGEYGTWNQHLRQMNASSIYQLVNGFQFLNKDCKADFRFWVDPAYGASTKLTIWTTTCLHGFLKSFGGWADNCFINTNPDKPFDMSYLCHLDVYNENENPFSLNIPLGCEVTQICLSPGTIVGWPNYLDGFVEVPLKDIMPITAFQFDPDAYCDDGLYDCVDGAYGFTYVTATTGLKAAQTLLAGERCARSNCYWVD